MPFPTLQKAGLHYVDHGGDGEPIVLVHGLGGAHTNWDLVAEGLARHGRVVAVDLPGFGVNPPEGPLDVNRYADLVAWFTEEHFGRPATVIGNSMGGLVALLTAERYPSKVSRLVLAAPALPPRVAKVTWANSQLVIRTIPGVGERVTQRAYARYSMEELTDIAFKTICADASVVPDAMKERSVVLAKWRKDAGHSISAFTEASTSILKILTRRRAYRRLLESITQPTMLIHGDSDPVVQPAAAVWAAAVRPDWRFEMLPGVGHVPMIERPEVFVDLVGDFIEADRPAVQSPNA